MRAFPCLLIAHVDKACRNGRKLKLKNASDLARIVANTNNNKYLREDMEQVRKMDGSAQRGEEKRQDTASHEELRNKHLTTQSAND